MGRHLAPTGDMVERVLPMNRQPGRLLQQRARRPANDRWMKGRLRFEGAWVRSTVFVLVGLTLSCGEEGLLPTTVDPGPDFNVSQVVFDENFYYCAVEPMLFRQSCGAGDQGAGDASGGCHFNVTSYRLINYSPQVGESCEQGKPAPGTSIPAAARQNYQLTQARMKRDPEVAPLLLRPTGQNTHPRTIFQEDSPDADLIRQWANQFSSQ